MPPKEQLVITAEEEAIIKQKIIEQTATLQPGKDYPLRKLVKTFFALNDAIDAGGEGLDAAQEAFLTELDTPPRQRTPRRVFKRRFTSARRIYRASKMR